MREHKGMGHRLRVTDPCIVVHVVVGLCVEGLAQHVAAQVSLVEFVEGTLKGDKREQGTEANNKTQRRRAAFGTIALWCRWWKQQSIRQGCPRTGLCT